MDQPENSFIELIEQTLLCPLERVSGWGLHLLPEQCPRWIHVNGPTASIPEQGWKLHVSATTESAQQVLGGCLPVLLREHASFKVVFSPRLLNDLNHGRAGISQIGKFLTVYPLDERHAIRLAVALHEATVNWRGPVIPSDWSFAPRSLVHYRYGGFKERLIQTPLGEIVPAIAGPDGTLIPDRRTQPPQPASWLTDPFVLAGCVASPAPPSWLIAGRYMLNAILHQSPRGMVYLGLDCKELRPCVLKAARKNDVIQADGRDACDRLRHEAAILTRLASNAHVPKLLDLQEHDNDLYLVMQDIEGESFVDHVNHLNAVGRHASTEHIIDWAYALATTLRGLHRDGLIHSDLNATNIVIAPDGRVHVLDFELAHDSKGNDGPHGLGTRGYVRPERRRDDVPVIADDIFGIGALLYFAATGAEPSQAPLSGGLLQRPIALLNPAVSPALVNLVTRCLDAEPAARFASMDDLCAGLDLVATQISSGHSAEHRWSVASPTYIPMQSDARWYAHHLGDALCSSARIASDGIGLEWVSSHDLSAGVPSYDLNAGSAGTVLALAELVGEIGDSNHRSVLTEASRRLAKVPGFEGQPLPGLYVGEAGIGAALLRAGQVLRDDQLIAAAEQRSRRIAHYPFRSPDLFNGTAGPLRFHLWLWYHTSEPEHLSYAVTAGEVLLNAAEDAGKGELRWTIPPGYDDLSGSAHLGYAHGAAGIADVLLDLFEATADERFLAAATGASRWLARLGVPALDDGSGLAWPITENGNLSPAFWCHGGTGIGRFFLHAAELGSVPGARDLAERAGRSVALGTRWAGTTQCHGLAGNIEFLLDLFQSTSDPKHLCEANSLACLLRAFGTKRDGRLLWPSESSVTFTPDYMVGYAGVAMTFLRLSAPDYLPHQMSVRCFRRVPPRQA